VGFSVVGDEYDSPVTFPLRLMDETLHVTDPFLRIGFNAGHDSSWKAMSIRFLVGLEVCACSLRA